MNFKIPTAKEKAYMAGGPTRVELFEKIEALSNEVASLRTRREQTRDYPELLEKNSRLTAEGARKDERIESLDEILEIAAIALSELVCLKDLKDKLGKTEKYIERQPEAWIVARSALTQIDHGPLFPLREQVEEILREWLEAWDLGRNSTDIVNRTKSLLAPASGRQTLCSHDEHND